MSKIKIEEDWKLRAITVVKLYKKNTDGSVSLLVVRQNLYTRPPYIISPTFAKAPLTQCSTAPYNNT